MTFEEWWALPAFVIAGDKERIVAETAWNAAARAEWERCAGTCDEMANNWLDMAELRSAGKRAGEARVPRIRACAAKNCAAAIREGSNAETNI